MVYKDIVIGAPGYDLDGRFNLGIVYVVFGPDHSNNLSLPSVIELSELDGSDGFAILGASGGDWCGWYTNPAGDINNDGVSDLLIGNYSSNLNECYVVYGRSGVMGSEFPSILDLNSLDSGSGIVIVGDSDGFRGVGHALSAVGDINCDGIDDFVIGASTTSLHTVSNAGAACVIYGRDASAGTFFPATLELANLNSIEMLVLAGSHTDAFAGTAVANAGDLNADGVGDIAVSAPNMDIGNLLNAGRVYVVYGGSSVFDGTVSQVSLDNLEVESGFAIDGIESSGFLGRSISSIGDIDSDTIDDFALTSFYLNLQGNAVRGGTYVLMGRDRCPADTSFDGILSLADFSAWIAAFNSQAPECDQNDDGLCNPADFTAWIANYNAGCG